MAVRPGEITARGLGRRFRVTTGTSRSVADLLHRRRASSTREFWALQGVELQIEPGESFGVFGRNGSGKSTLLNLMAGIFPPSAGTLEVGGRVGSLLALGAGFHPEFSGVENVYLNAAIHGLGQRYVDEHIEEIVAFAELEEFAHMSVKTYSTGMFMRLGFAVAVHIRPDILLVDEILAVGDEAFQQKCFARIAEFVREGGTLVLVSHDLRAIERLCTRALLLDAGRVVEIGRPDRIVRTYHSILSQERSSNARELEPAGGGRCRIVDVRAVDGLGAVRDRLIAGEPAMLEIELDSDNGLRGAQVTLSVRDIEGASVGSQTATDVWISPEGRSVLRLHFAALPFGEGRFRVDLAVTDAVGETLAEVEDALELSVFNDDLSSAGPIRLGGAWEVPDGRGSPRADEP
jgi:ABC-2 type transport system ATP-binding protein